MECGVAMAHVFLTSHRSTSALARGLARLERSFPCRHYAPVQKSTLSSTLSRLHGQGLVAREGGRKYAQWRITARGRAYVAKEKEREAAHILPEKDGKIRLITFDIPEQERAKRSWLRRELLACDFKPLHKSVWIGGRSLPREFIEAIDQRNLGTYVHIIGLDARGTLSRLLSDV